MKNLYIACFIILAFTSNSFAKLLFIPLEEAIKNSDLIVIGTLKDITEKSEAGVTTGKGKIVVEQFVAGNVKNTKGISLKSGDELQLNYVESFACVYGSHKRIENEKGIFLLKLNTDGEIQYEDFRSLESLSEIKKLLKKGIKPSEVAKIIKIKNADEQISQPSLAEQTPEITICPLYSEESKQKEYSPFQAFLVILASISLYFLLYRSRFKIR